MSKHQKAKEIITDIPMYSELENQSCLHAFSSTLKIVNELYTWTI